MLVKKAIIPVAGLGTRFLPATKAIPKEMIPIVDKPAIQYIIEEAVSSGIEDITLITGRGKDSIIDHFDVSGELEYYLDKRGKTELLKLVQDISNMARINAVRQKKPLGLGHAVLCAKNAVGKEPFVVMLGDDMADTDPPLTRQMVDIFEEYQHGVIALQRVPDDKTHLYGIIEGEEVKEGLYQIKGVTEKPKQGTAPTNLAIIGRYVLPPRIFEILENVSPDKSGEIQLTDGLLELSKKEALYGHVFTGDRYDIGDKLGFVQATVLYALKDPLLGDKVRAFLKGIE